MLTEDEAEEHRDAMGRQPVSGPYKGPYAVFNESELRHIRQMVAEGFGSLSVINKIDRALQSSHKFKEPHS